MNISPYLRLMRMHQPAGIPLLLWPCWWAIALASDGLPPLDILALFAAGAVLMRGAGCIINDIADRDIDSHVVRTKTRPIASGELNVRQALMFLVLLLLISLGIAWQLGWVVVMWAALSLIPVAIYPFMKRISWWPQLFLGLTFNWGALMGWAAITGKVELPALLLYAGGVFWTLGYDTIYAHQDKIDDKKIGVKSTALRLGRKTRPALVGFYGLSLLLWVLAGFSAGATLPYFITVLFVLLHFGWQVKALSTSSPISCKKLFKSNSYQLGALMFIACILA